MPTAARLIHLMETIAPTSHAEPWDNVGLLVGDPDRSLAGPVLLTIDLTEPVTREALELKAGAVIAYHPPLFHPRKRLTTHDAQGRSLLALIEHGIAVYSPHTALDAADGGVTDWLIDQLAPSSDATPTNRHALTPHQHLDANQTHKLVTFVPGADADRIRQALANAGAGNIGQYALCSFNLQGKGTFHAADDANPSTGATGRLETVDEVRLEMVCPAARLAEIIDALRATHPYEEPAFDLYKLEPAPIRTQGGGRAATLQARAKPSQLAQQLKTNLHLEAVKLATPNDDPLTRVAACPGAGASLLDAAIGAGCQLFVTGEMRHHEVLAALDQGCSVILAGHTNTERGYLPHLKERLNQLEPTLDIHVSAQDKSPLRFI